MNARTHGLETYRHIAYQDRAGGPVELEADYIVVGSGAGGAAVAVGLARGGADVLIVEAGPWREPKDYPSSAYGAMRDMIDNWGLSIAQGRAMWPIVQGRVVGGSTTINSAIVVRTPGDVFEDWRRDYGVAGGVAGSTSSGTFADAVWRYQDQVEVDLSVQFAPGANWGRANQLIQRGAEALGLHDHDMLRNADQCAGAGQCLQGCRKGHKKSTNLNYIPEVLERGGRIMSCAPVKKVIFEGRTAVGVTGVFKHPTTKKAGAVFTARAKKVVIIAASATHSPALLQRSGVRSKTLGRFFRSHPGSGVFGVYDDPVHMNNGTTQGWASTSLRESHGIKLETLSLPLELVASRFSGAGQRLIARLAEFDRIAMFIAAVRAKSHGTVRSVFGQPVVSYSMQREDMAKLREGLYRCAKLHVAAGARKVIPGIHGLPFSLPANDIAKMRDASLDPRAYTAVMSHIFGGCVMGSDPRRSVCDEHGRVWGYERLVVADASAFPDTIGVNPQHTIMGIGLLRAEQLLAA